MSSIVLSASVRQNLLSLQSTADLLSTTQNRLATGNKVNSALDNPTSFFTAQSLNYRASDISNLLDGIGNGVQVLQSANTGITSLQKLTDTAKSIASQVLQTSVGYSAKSSTTSATITGATASSLLGSGGAYTDATVTGGAEALATGTITAASGLNFGPNELHLISSDVFAVNGKTISFNSGAGTSGSATAGTLSIDVTTGTIQDILNGIDAITGTAVPSSIDGSGHFVLHTGTASNLVLTDTSGFTLQYLGLTAGTTPRGGGAGLSGETLTIGATGGGVATNITFGAGGGQVSTLDQLNAALAANNLQASIASGKITLTTTNDAASSTIGAIGGTAAASGQAFNGLTISSPVADAASQAIRSNLVSQYNNIIAQITTTAQDASFNGINLLNGDNLKLTFNETGKSTLAITGVTFSATGLGLKSLAAGTDFLDNNSANNAIAALSTASTSLRTQASALGSNLSIVQIRQDFSKSLINVLQTGSSNLTLADTNEEAANSQALSTRQSIAVSALSLANQSQQSVLQLLR